MVIGHQGEATRELGGYYNSTHNDAHRYRVKPPVNWVATTTLRAFGQ